MIKNDDIQYWVDRFIPLFRDYISDVIDEKEFEEKTGILHMEMEQNFSPDELVCNIIQADPLQLSSCPPVLMILTP